jgi:lipoprotein-anchoring transpeptidase ErfK/SrfK
MYGGSKAAGDYFYLPNVEYISWFYGEYSIHGAYWNKFIGVKSTSHGCVNMTNADASFIYDWAPVGTKVVIHA